MKQKTNRVFMWLAIGIGVGTELALALILLIILGMEHDLELFGILFYFYQYFIVPLLVSLITFLFFIKFIVGKKKVLHRFLIELGKASLSIITVIFLILIQIFAEGLSPFLELSWGTMGVVCLIWILQGIVFLIQKTKCKFPSKRTPLRRRP